MARITSDPNYTVNTFPRATAGTDLFVKEDVQGLALAVSTHDHSTGKGLPLTASAIPSGTITSAMIADGTIVAGDIADGAITSAKILDGTIATADLANASVTNAKLASDTARDNLLTNGGFELWQRGTGPFTTSYFADRYVIDKQGTDTLSISRDTTNVDVASLACAACTFTLGTGAGLTSFYQQLNWLGDGPNPRGKTVSYSVRVRCSTANAVRIGVQELPSATYTYSSFHTGGGSYETLTVTVAVSLSSTYHLIRVFFAASCTAYIDNAMLAVGSQAADYAPVHPADELARCLRYYQKHMLSVRWWALNPGVTQFIQVPLRAPMPVTPTVTVTPGSRNNISGSYPISAIADFQNVTWQYAPTTATGVDTYALNEVYVLEANP